MPFFRNFPATHCSGALARAIGRWTMAGLLVLWLGGCAVERYFLEYRINVQQGNLVEQKQIVQLRPGMTRDQVRFVLGTPLLQDPFHAERWDYVYRFENGQTGEITMRNIFMYFNSAGLLERVGGDVAAGQPADVQFTGNLDADAAAAAGVAAVVRSNEPQVIDLGTLPDDAEGPPEGAVIDSDSWWWRFIHLFK
jgi:outer membrane protein assembly factor BamE